ncbi:MAG: lipocalin family protein [Candidatus Hydrogenedentota bacterium]
MAKSMQQSGMVWVAALAAAGLAGCPSYGPEPETVDFVDVEQYAGLWHEIASNPVFFNKDLVAVTAEYEIIGPGRISVLNMGREGSPEGPVQRISGVAQVVDEQTNSKLSVRFGTGLFSRLFAGEYWIVLLDEESYEYAVVTDSRQFTLFVLYREPEMPGVLFDQILDELAAKKIDTNRLEITGAVMD